MGGSNVDGWIRETVAEAIYADHYRCKDPRAETKKRKADHESCETSRADPREPEARNDNTGQDNPEEAPEILRRKEKTGLRVSQAPLPRKKRQDRPKQRRYHTDQNKTDVKQEPFIPRIWLRETGGRGH